MYCTQSSRRISALALFCLLPCFCAFGCGRESEQNVKSNGDAKAKDGGPEQNAKSNGDTKLKEDRSIVITDLVRRPGPEGPKGHVNEEGSAFDKAIIDLKGIKKVIVPENAKVSQAGDGKPIMQILMKKTWWDESWGGGATSIRTERKFAGCVVKKEENALVLATFGEFDDRHHSGLEMRLVLVVPKIIQVVRRAGLSGSLSVGGSGLATPRRPPAKGWTVVAAEPDPERRAKESDVR